MMSGQARRTSLMVSTFAWGDHGFAGGGLGRDIEMRATFKKMRRPGPLMQRIDKIAADLNVVLLIFAVGLATLDLTFMVTQRVVDRLPQVTRLVDDAAPAANTAPAAEHK
jgi:hypothetical protein